MATQFDIIRNQAEAAARNAAARVRGGLRRDTSLVNQASRWAGRTLTQGEAAVRARAGEARRRSSAARETTATQAHPVRPAPDGYVRRSPVQPLHAAAGHPGRHRRGGAGGRGRGHLSAEHAWDLHPLSRASSPACPVHK